MRPFEPFRQKAAMAGISLISEDEDVTGLRLYDGNAVHVPAKVLDEALSLRAAPIGRAVVVGEFERPRDKDHEPRAINTGAASPLMSPGNTQPCSRFGDNRIGQIPDRGGGR